MLIPWSQSGSILDISNVQLADAAPLSDPVETHPVGIITQLHGSATPGQRYGSFAGKPTNATLNLDGQGIATAEAFGTATLHQDLTLSGIPSAEAFGTLQLDQFVVAPSLASEEAFGTLTVATEGGAHPVVLITQLALHATPTQRYSSFAGKPTGAVGAGSLIDHSYRRGRGRR